MNSSSRILHITPIGVVISMLFLGIVEDDFFKTLFFLNGIRSTDPVYLIGHVLILLSYLTSSLVVLYMGTPSFGPHLLEETSSPHSDIDHL